MLGGSPGHRDRGYEVPGCGGVGDSRYESLQKEELLGEQPGKRAEGGQERGLVGFVGPVKRFVLSLTCRYGVLGKGMAQAGLNFGEVSPTTAGRVVRQAMRVSWVHGGGEGSRRREG